MLYTRRNSQLAERRAYGLRRGSKHVWLGSFLLGGHLHEPFFAELALSWTTWPPRCGDWSWPISLIPFLLNLFLRTHAPATGRP